MNKFCTDIGYLSVNHFGEELCGDHVEVVPHEPDSTVVVLADGLGSGVKASILSTLTSKIISTMLAQGASLEDCVNTIVDTLPVDSKKGVAYSTFTIIRLIRNQTAELIQYDNPQVIVLRNGENWSLGDSPVVGALLGCGWRGNFHSETAPRIADDLRYLPNPGGKTIRVYDSVDVRFILEDMYAKLALCTQ